MKAFTLRSVLLGSLAIIAGCVLAIHSNHSSIVYAQSVPTTVRAQWQPNDTADKVISYTVTLDGGAPVTVQPVTDATCACVQTTLSIPAFGAHTFTVVANNLLLTTDPASGQQSSAATVVAFSLNKSPAVVTGAGVKK